jgi:hypothetical protein
VSNRIGIVEVMQEIQFLTGDKSPKLKWVIDENRSLVLIMSVLINGKLHNQLHKSAGWKDFQGDIESLIYDTCLMALRRNIDISNGLVMPGIKRSDRDFIDSQVAEFPELADIINEGAL